MKKLLPVLALAACAAFAHTGAWAATYTYTGPTYTSPQNYTAPCASGICANFDTTMRQTGSFTTNQPLAPDLHDADISALIQSYSFNDGITHYSSLGANDLTSLAEVTTDAVGNITSANIIFRQWQTNSHSAGDRLSYIAVNTGSYVNLLCTSAVPPSQCNGLTKAPDGSTSQVFASDTGPFKGWTPVATLPALASIPTLSEWGLLLLAALLGVLVLVPPVRRKLASHS